MTHIDKELITPKTSRKSLLGAGLAASLASVCCIGPVVLVALGAGGAWAGSFALFEPIRPYLIVLTLGLLGYSFYQLYWKPDKGACEPGTACANPRADRFNKISLWIVTTVILVLLSVPYIIPTLHARDMEPLNPDQPGQSVDLVVSGMTCTSCEITYEKFVSSLDGVIEVDADYASGSAVVRYDSVKVSLEDVIDQTRRIGFNTKLSDKPSGDYK